MWPSSRLEVLGCGDDVGLCKLLGASTGERVAGVLLPLVLSLLFFARVLMTGCLRGQCLPRSCGAGVCLLGVAGAVSMIISSNRPAQVPWFSNVGDEKQLRTSLHHWFDGDAAEPRRQCRWLLLAGDSNTRSVLERLEHLLTDADGLSAFKMQERWPPASLRAPAPQCFRVRRDNTWLRWFGDPRCGRADAAMASKRTCLNQANWFDREYMLTRVGSPARGEPHGLHNSSCLLVSFYFMTAQGQLARLASTARTGSAWRHPRPCGIQDFSSKQWAACKQDNSCCERYRTMSACHRRTMRAWQGHVLHLRPDFAWIAHGLWGIAKGDVRELVQTTSPPNCTKRFEAEMNLFARLQASGVPSIAWATNFQGGNSQNKEHQKLNHRLKLDGLCQQQIASMLPAVRLINLSAMVDSNVLRVNPDDFNLSVDSYQKLARMLVDLATSSSVPSAKRTAKSSDLEL